METELDKYNPCGSALEFRKKYKTFEEAWEACHRGDWMLWIAGKLKVNKRLLYLAKGYCAETVIHLMRDERSKNAVKAAIGYGKNKITDKELKIAAVDAAAAAAVDAVDAAAADAATAADAAVYAAYAAAADAAIYAATAVYAVDAAAAKKKNQLATSKICREILTNAVIKLI